MKILGIAGSLRTASLNRALLDAAAELAPEGVTLTVAELEGIPLFNADLEPVPVVEAFKQAIADADAVLIATPEYNYGIPGVLKNALDWASRPAYRSVFAGKPVAVVSASPSIVGGVRAQGHLKLVLLGMASEVFPYPEFLVTGAHHKFDSGRLTDESTREHLEKLLGNLVLWVGSRKGD